MSNGEINIFPIIHLVKKASNSNKKENAILKKYEENQ